MGREVRRVPEDWEHPKSDRRGGLEPLYDGYNKDLKDFEEKAEAQGIEEAIEYYGGGPLKENYMPDWPEEERTHLMMYETCSEGTPISPGFKTPEELARWLTDNKASAFGGMTATYEQWLNTCKSGFAVSAVMTVGSEGGKMESGVAAMHTENSTRKEQQ